MEYKLFDIKFKIEYLFFVVITIGLFDKTNRILYVLLFSSLHELGHIITLIIFGGKADTITFSFYGIGLKYFHNLSFIKEIIFLLSGLIVNSFFVMINLQREINLCLLLINILPIYPLDMGRCLVLIINRFAENSISYKLCYTFSFLFWILFLILSIYQKNFNLLAISVYLFFWLIRGNYD